VGFVAGVYSTVYVAAPLVLWLERWWQRPVAVRAR
jgi:preprotein translocase subunit SecF